MDMCAIFVLLNPIAHRSLLSLDNLIGFLSAHKQTYNIPTVLSQPLSDSARRTLAQHADSSSDLAAPSEPGLAAPLEPDPHY